MCHFAVKKKGGGEGDFKKKSVWQYENNAMESVITEGRSNLVKTNNHSDTVNMMFVTWINLVLCSHFTSSHHLPGLCGKISKSALETDHKSLNLSLSFFFFNPYYITASSLEQNEKNHARSFTCGAHLK